MTAMQESLRRFSDSLLEMQGRRGKQTHDLKQMEEAIFSVLEKAQKSFTEDGSIRSEAVKEITGEIFSRFTQTIAALRKEVKERSQVRESLEKLGDGLIVVVFGCTNAGKSTLGNFLRGKQLREAAFDNAWKDGSIKKTPITVIERSTGSEVPLEQEWFIEDCTEATREIQAFALPGLLWVDTPGFGSTKDSTLGELARTYVKRADLVIYLDSSDGPGLRDITENLVKVLKDSRRTLIAINKSDKMEMVRKDGKVIFEHGKPLQEWIPKSDEDRKKQENYLTKELGKKLPDQTIHVISISTKLAGIAVESNDADKAERLYKGANLHALFTELAEVSREDLKYQEAIGNCVSLIDMALSDLTDLQKRLEDFEKRIKEKEEKFLVDGETENILSPLHAALNQELKRCLQQSAASSRVDPRPIFDKLTESANEKIKEEMKKLQDFWRGEALEFTHPMCSLSAVTVEEKKTKIEQDEWDTVTTVRDPEGVWEKISSFLFDTVYHETHTRKRRKIKTIQLGPYVEKAHDELSEQILPALKDYVRESLAGIRNTFLTQGRELSCTRRMALESAISDLKQRRDELCAERDAHSARL